MATDTAVKKASGTRKPRGRQAAQEAPSKADAKRQLGELVKVVRTKGHTSGDVRRARVLAQAAGVDVPAWAAEKSKSSAGSRAARPQVDGRYVAAARYANGGQGGLRGDGPRAPVTGPNLVALERALTAAKADPTFGHERQLRAFATSGKDLPAELKASLRAFVHDQEGIDARTFYGRKLARMLVALVDMRAGKVNV